MNCLSVMLQKSASFFPQCKSELNYAERINCYNLPSFVFSHQELASHMGWKILVFGAHMWLPDQKNPQSARKAPKYWGCLLPLTHTNC